jgi:octaprenyl-diphosphate synthase
MTVSEIQAFLGEDWERVRTLLQESLRSDVELLDRTNASLIANGGKMLRPMLSLLVSKACGGSGDECIRVAVASELLHNATLLHDDVLDGGQCRRGAPTVLSTLGAKPSVLIGDFWLVKTMTTVLHCGEHFREVSDLFARTEQDLVEGELLQMAKAASGDTSEEDYMKIIYLKTASLFQTICSSAALVAEAPANYAEAVKEYGRLLGMAFQIKDDIMDYEGGPLGKPAGADLKEGQITLPLLGALRKLDAAREKEIRQMVSALPQQPGTFAEVSEMVRKLEGIEYARIRLEYFVRQAKEALRALPDSQSKICLLQLADYCTYRTI